MRKYSRFRDAINRVGHDLKTLSYEVDSKRWQSSDVSDYPEMKTREVFNTSFTVNINDEDHTSYQSDIGPNLPWADNHFEERVGGLPLNPGERWKDWPWSNRADSFRDSNDQFSHTYMERYWPKLANQEDLRPNQGIRYWLGDLSDVVQHLTDHPESRQAYLPVWFPEDTGVVHEERVPCTLGYHFLYRMGYLHCTYYIRSCDFVRHFRDDLYLSVRLMQWMLDCLRVQPGFENIQPGVFVFHCVSMHCFENDYQAICEDF